MSTPPAEGTDPAPPALHPATGEFLTALASPTRQRVLLLFARGAELAVGQVAEQAGLSQPAASQQLQILRRGGVVTSRRAGRTVLYRADRDGAARALDDLQGYLRTCC